jgi:hypothetical protein
MGIGEQRDTAGNVWRPAPYQSAPAWTGSVTGVWAGPDDEVDWIWTHGLGGSYVSGYTVKRKALMEVWTFNDAKGKDGA